jgi:hypothetical protein
MKPILVCLALLTASEALLAASVKVVSGQGRTKQMQALKDGKPIVVEMQTIRISVGFPNGKQTDAYLFMLREPQSRLYWWTYQGIAAGGASSEPSLDYVLYFTDNKAGGFNFSTPRLLIREIQGQKPDFAAIQQAAIAEVERNAQAIQDGSMQWVREVNLSSVGRDFLYLQGSASFFPQPKVTAVSHANGRWEVTLEGPNHDFAYITLDDQYTLINARRGPAPR